jgi:hypothetical protein
MIYLASPYSNDPEGNYAAMLDVCKRLVSREVAGPVGVQPGGLLSFVLSQTCLMSRS